MTKRVAGVGAQPRGLPPGQLSFEETSKQWQAVGDTEPSFRMHSTITSPHYIVPLWLKNFVKIL